MPHSPRAQCDGRDLPRSHKNIALYKLAYKIVVITALMPRKILLNPGEGD
jgi:hypothetical protein